MKKQGVINTNKLTIIGNVCKDPELRTTQSGLSVCSFSVAVNRRRTQANGQPEADFFRVSAWRQLGENCAKYLAKGRKVCVIGPVTLNTFNGQDGASHASLEVTADDVEFLTPRSEAGGDPAYSASAAPAAPAAPAAKPNIPAGAQYVDPGDESLPF